MPRPRNLASFASLGNVPSIILGLVASVVTAKDLLRLELTSKGIQEALHDGVAVLTFPPGKATDAAVIAMAKHCPALVTLSLACCDEVNLDPRGGPGAGRRVTVKPPL